MHHHPRTALIKDGKAYVQAGGGELRFFAGLSIEDATEALNMSPATLKRRWALARAWLFRELSEPGV